MKCREGTDLYAWRSRGTLLVQMLSQHLGGGVRRNSERRNVLGGHRRERSLVQGIGGQVTVGEGMVGTRRRTGPLRSYSPNSLLEFGTLP